MKQHLASMRASAAIESSLDDDLAEIVRGLEWQKRTMERDLLMVQGVRLQRQLLEQLQKCNPEGKACRNG